MVVDVNDVVETCDDEEDATREVDGVDVAVADDEGDAAREVDGVDGVDGGDVLDLAVPKETIGIAGITRTAAACNYPDRQEEQEHDVGQRSRTRDRHATSRKMILGLGVQLAADVERKVQRCRAPARWVSVPNCHPHAARTMGLKESELSIGGCSERQSTSVARARRDMPST